MVNFLGKTLSNLINKPELASKGFIRFAFKDAGLSASLTQNSLDLREINNVIRNELKIRLEKLRIESVNEVVSSLSAEMTKSQAIITMSR